MILETNARERERNSEAFLIGVTVANANGNEMSSINSFTYAETLGTIRIVNSSTYRV